MHAKLVALSHTKAFRVALFPDPPEGPRAEREHSRAIHGVSAYMLPSINNAYSQTHASAAPGFIPHGPQSIKYANDSRIDRRHPPPPQRRSSSSPPSSSPLSLPHKNTGIPYLNAIPGMRLFYDAHATRTFETTNLVLNLVVALAVLLSTHLPCLRARFSSELSPASPRTPCHHRQAIDHLIIQATDVFAFLTLASALLAFAAPTAPLAIYHNSEEASREVTHPRPDVQPVISLGAGPALALTIFVVLSLACTATFIWQLYVMSRAMQGKVVPRWKTVAAYAYISIPHLGVWVAFFAPTQLLFRDPRLLDKYGSLDGNFGFVSIVGAACAFLFVFVNLGMMAAFLRGNTAALTVEEGVLVDETFSPMRVIMLFSISRQAVFFVFLSLCLYGYVWLVFLISPAVYAVGITTPPYHVCMLLLIHFCFGCRSRESRCCVCGNKGGEEEAGEEA